MRLIEHVQVVYPLKGITVGNSNRVAALPKRKSPTIVLISALAAFVLVSTPARGHPPPQQSYEGCKSIPKASGGSPRYIIPSTDHHYHGPEDILEQDFSFFNYFQMEQVASWFSQVLPNWESHEIQSVREFNEPNTGRAVRVHFSPRSVEYLCPRG